MRLYIVRRQNSKLQILIVHTTESTRMTLLSLFHLLLFSRSECPTPWTAAHQASLSHQIPELAEIHVHGVSDAIQPSHPPPSPSPAFNLF